MGDRTTYYYKCPKCGRENGVEVYDAPSCLMYVESCQFCDYKVDKDYYEVDENHITLIDKKEARELGYLCKKCDRYLYFEERAIGICEDCFNKAEEKENEEK
jgi:anaerobic ribonucleoside-triphosphate reductase